MKEFYGQGSMRMPGTTITNLRYLGNRSHPQGHWAQELPGPSYQGYQYHQPQGPVHANFDAGARFR